MKNLFAPCTPARPIALAATLFACGTVEMFAQAAPANQDVQALVAEIRELKSRLAAVEAKLDAYQAAEDYLTENWERYCGYHGPTNCEYAKKNYFIWVSLLRARASLKNGDYEKAISNLDRYIAGGPGFAANCAQLYRMRAHAYRKLGQIELARADEKKASQLSDQSNCIEGIGRR